VGNATHRLANLALDGRISAEDTEPFYWVWILVAPIREINSSSVVEREGTSKPPIGDTTQPL